MRDYGTWGAHNELLEAWWDQVLLEASQSNRLTEAERLIEAETKIDFADWLHGYVATSFYAAYEEAQTQWRKYAGVKPVRDFKEQKIKGRNRLVGFGYVGDHAHKPGMRRSFRPEASLFIDTYGAEHEITRQAIINQESDEFLRDDPQDMGSAAADFLARAIIALIVSNPNAPDGSPMYSTGRGNQVSVELSESSLLAAWTAMQTQRDDDDRPIRITPRHIVVQNKTMGSIVDRSINSQVTGVTQASGGASTVEKGTLNVVARQGIPEDFTVEEPYLPDANDWYLMADPDKIPAFMVGLLRGQEEPAIYQSAVQRRPVSGSGVSDPYQLRVAKIGWEVEWDLGVSAIDPRATYRGVPA
jgi:hypothetical protein